MGKPLVNFACDKDRSNDRELELLIISCGMVNHDDVISEELALFADAISGVWSPNTLIGPVTSLCGTCTTVIGVAKDRFLGKPLLLSRVKLNCRIVTRVKMTSNSKLEGVMKNPLHAVSVKTCREICCEICRVESSLIIS